MGTSAGAVHFRDSSLCIATWENIFFNFWHDKPSMERLGRVEQEQNAFIARTQAKIGNFTVLEEFTLRMGMVSASERAYAAQIAESVTAAMAASAHVIIGRGMFASAVRNVFAGITLLAKPKYPFKIFDGVQAATEWLAPLVGQPATALAAAVAQARRASVASEGLAAV